MGDPTGDKARIELLQKGLRRLLKAEKPLSIMEIFGTDGDGEFERTAYEKGRRFVMRMLEAGMIESVEQVGAARGRGGKMMFYVPSELGALKQLAEDEVAASEFLWPPVGLQGLSGAEEGLLDDEEGEVEEEVEREVAPEQEGAREQASETGEDPMLVFTRTLGRMLETFEAFGGRLVDLEKTVRAVAAAPVQPLTVQDDRLDGLDGRLEGIEKALGELGVVVAKPRVMPPVTVEPDPRIALLVIRQEEGSKQMKTLLTDSQQEVLEAVQATQGRFDAVLSNRIRPASEGVEKMEKMMKASDSRAEEVKRLLTGMQHGLEELGKARKADGGGGSVSTLEKSVRKMGEALSESLEGISEDTSCVLEDMETLRKTCSLVLKTLEAVYTQQDEIMKRLSSDGGKAGEDGNGEGGGGSEAKEEEDGKVEVKPAGKVVAHPVEPAGFQDIRSAGYQSVERAIQTAKGMGNRADEVEDLLRGVFQLPRMKLVSSSPSEASSLPELFPVKGLKVTLNDAVPASGSGMFLVVEQERKPVLREGFEEF